MSGSEQEQQRFTIFREKDAPGLMEAECMSFGPSTPTQQAGLEKLREAGYALGDELKVLCNIPGFSLTYVWFKKGYPLPLHSHDVDCLYYIIAGSIRLGSQELGPSDSFFIPADCPYTYTPGEDGVEVLEFRHANEFTFLNLAKGEAFWNRAAKTVSSSQDEWSKASRPSAAAPH